MNQSKIYRDLSNSKYGSFAKTNTETNDKSLNTLHNFKQDSYANKAYNTQTLKTLNLDDDDCDLNMNKTDSMYGNMTTTLGEDQFKSLASLNASRRMLWRKRIDYNFTTNTDRVEHEHEHETRNDHIDELADAMGMGRMEFGFSKPQDNNLKSIELQKILS